MLYLMLMQSNKNCYAKVGYSKSGVANRRRAYKTHNPAAIMRSSCAGAEEISCRAKLEDMGGVRVKGSEWFIVSHAVYQKLYDEGMAVFKPKQKPFILLNNFRVTKITLKFCAICLLTGCTHYGIIGRAAHGRYGPKFVKNLTIGKLEIFSTFIR